MGRVRARPAIAGRVRVIVIVMDASQIWSSRSGVDGSGVGTWLGLELRVSLGTHKPHPRPTIAACGWP